MKALIILIFLIFSTSRSSAQLGFCNGSKGDPIFFEDFGSGTNFGPPLPAGTTSYDYFNGVPNDGQYTLYNKMNLNAAWHNSDDHTPDDQTNGVNGKALVVNAGFTAGEFYSRTVSNLCVNTTFEFTAWLMNVYNSAATNACPGTGIPVDVTFQIWDATETQLLKEGVTGPINGTPNPIWTQFGLTFTTLSNQTSVVLKMKNNGAGGCGNDLAIDDIMFRSCGDITTISSPQSASANINACEDEGPITATLNVVTASGSPHAFQWQESTDNISWVDIPGETSATFFAQNVITTTYYRVKVAQDAANLANSFCYTLSDAFSILIVPKPLPPVSNGNQIICSGNAIPPLSVIPLTGEQITWYDAPSGGNVLANTAAFTPQTSGTYYAEASVATNCKSDTRTPVSLTINPQPVIADDANFDICEGQKITLNGGISSGVTYLWSALETTQTITVEDAGVYSVTVTDSTTGCTNAATFTVVKYLAPVISEILIEGSTVTIQTLADGSFEYSLDGSFYQSSNIFTNVRGGIKTAFVRETHFCGSYDENFVLIIVPAFFTPNGDGYNDVLKVDGLEAIPNAKLSIFDRYGKLITVLQNQNMSWDGMLNGINLPASDYWYHAEFDGKPDIRGHFSIVR